MKYITSLILFAVILNSCEEAEPADKDLFVYQDAQIQEEFPYLESGDNLVFKYYYVSPDDPQIADEEYTDEFFFEIVPDGNSFSFSSEDLALINLPFRYNQYSFVGRSIVRR